jgi:hypothetical protein
VTTEGTRGCVSQTEQGMIADGELHGSRFGVHFEPAGA